MLFGNKFLESPRGQMHAYRARARRAFTFWWDGELETKTSKSAKASIGFQKKLFERMQGFGRHAMTGRVVMELEFWTSVRNTGAVHSLAKHYLDLLVTPLPEARIPRKRLLLKDDSQIEFLICIYDVRSESNGLRVRVQRIADFFQDLELYSDIMHGNLEGPDEDWREKLPKDDFEDVRDPVDDFRIFRNSKKAYEARYGRESYKKVELIYKRDAQLSMLRGKTPRLEQFASLFGPRYHPFREQRKIAEVLEATSGMVRSLYESPVMSIDFGPRALEKGGSEKFRENIQKALLSARDRNPMLYPLLAPCGVTIFYLPPANAQSIDLDNLVRKFIIPQVHDILKPPTTPRDFLTEINAGETMDKTLRGLLAGWEHAPKFHIAYYQVISLSRTSKDPPKGNVRLLVHGAEREERLCQVLGSVLDTWADSVEESV
jgi:hypothetical protein